jgi:tetratricopeptide (TPR) repeat protein
VPIDRAATLRNAEKFLKQGKLDSAIAEYVRIVDDQPRDWNTANALGDLYVRAGRPDKAIEQFARIADGFAAEGFLPKAAALYKKILKLRPDDERALLQAAEFSAAQGLLVDARSYLKTVVERRRARGDQRGAAEAELRLGALDPSDYHSRIAASQARASMGQAAEAVVELKALAGELREKGRVADAIAALRAAVDIAPAADELHAELFREYLKSGDAAGAREWAKRPADYEAIADTLSAAGQRQQAIEVLRHGISRYPGEARLRHELARALVADGDVAGAAAFFDRDAGDASTAFRIAEAHLAAGRLDDAIELLRDVLESDPLRREDVARLGWSTVERAPDATFAVIELAVDMAAAQGDFNWGALALQEFVRRTPGHVPALLRLVEVCVDGDLDRTIPLAQAQLADAYLNTGAAAEARVIAEDLVSRNPASAAHVERLRRAYEMGGDPDPDAAVERFLTPTPEGDDEPEADAEHVAAELPARADSVAVAGPSQPESNSEFDLTAAPFDIERLLRELEEPEAPPDPEHVEVDLSVALDGIKRGAAPPPRIAATSSEAPGADINDVFQQIRREASARRGGDTGEQDYARGRMLFEAGDHDGALEALTAAARSPRTGFQAGSLGARICRTRGRTAQAIEWLERAVAAPAPSAEEAHALLYELADLLESQGEAARALAVCLELQAEAGTYRDVNARVGRLAKAQARG